MSRWVATVLVAVLAVSACGEDGRPQPQGPAGARVVRGSVELERPRAGAPDAGTAAGHGAGTAIASTSRRSFVIRGQVDPRDSAVTIVDSRTGRRATVDVRGEGRFAARVTGLRPGTSSFRLEATKRGYERWTLEVRVTRVT